MSSSRDRPRIGLVWAQAEGGVIGRGGAMPWHVPEDLAHFAQVTRGSPVVMGRATWDSLTEKYRPLPGRRNIVVTRQADWSAPGAESARSIDAALDLAADEGPDAVWVIGGGTIFAEVITRPDVTVLEVTVLTHPDGFAVDADDALAPPIDTTVFALVAADPDAGEYTSRSGIRYRFLRYERMPPA